MSNKRAFICFCVEGTSDRLALKEQITQLFDEKFGDSVFIDFRIPENLGKEDKKQNQGDLTSKPGINPESIEKEIYKYYFKNHKQSTDISWEDFTAIVHIIDIDGVYCDNVARFTPEEERQA